MATLATASQQSTATNTEKESDPPPLPSTKEDVDQKESRQRATEFLKEAESTRRLVEKLEKERSLSAQCRRNGWKDMATELDEYEKTLGGQRSAEKSQLRKRLSKIQKGVKQFQEHLININPTTEKIEKLKEIMSQVEFSINELKEVRRLNIGELLKEEKICSQEMAAYKMKIENWDLHSKSDSHVPAVKQSKALDRDLPIEVQALEAFLQNTGGICGGWDEFDHQAFLKAWTMYNGQAGFKKGAKLYLSNKSPEEVAKHKQWYQELLYLQGKKREAIQRWKSRKQLESKMHIEKQIEVLDAKKKEKRAKCQQKTDEKKKMVAQQLDEWKEVKRKKEEQKRAEEIQKRMAQEHLFQQAKETNEDQEDSKMTRKRRGRTKNVSYMIKRDLKQLQAKNQEKLLRQKEEKEHQERILAKLKEKVDGHIGRDPARLSQPTKGWEERLKSAPSRGGPLRYMSHRPVTSRSLGL
ncbi:coiled-coil domain-containing protein 112-like isoform X2 [Stigmatopora nigra]